MPTLAIFQLHKYKLTLSIYW